jgi:CarboxypepD_reg-like domain/TonB-dependent Receptor Plug Domain
MLKYIVTLAFTAFSCMTFAQKAAIVRGNVYDKANGQPVPFANVILRGTSLGSTTDLNGFFQINNAPVGEQTLFVSFIGYDSVETKVAITEGGIVYKSFYLAEAAKNLETVEVSAKKEIARTTAQVSKITVTQKQIKTLPSTGGAPDIAQYLPVLAGVISSGDQGGQIYIRGGSPVQNKILLDGMTIYNPFHSIGFFSVFETETIRSVDVLTGGFNAQYGGRISAIVDLKTREGNKKRFSGLVSGSPFQAKALIEGPLLKLKNDNGTSISFMLTGKKSLLPETSKTLYKYAGRDSANGLPFDYSDYYGKVSLVAANGSKLNVFGFNFQDGVNYTNIADLSWKNKGYGANFSLIPTGLKMIVGGNLAFSQYNISLQEKDPTPRLSGVNSFNAGLDFTIFGNNSELKYGVDISGFSTDLAFTSPLGFTYKQNENTTELAGFINYRKTFKRLVIEPSLRVQSYTALGETTFEPRFAAKLNATDHFRFKFSGGLYSQNLISTVSEKDIVNLFVGFISGPEEQFFKPGTNEVVTTRLQKAVHIIGGFEIDVNKYLELNVEAYNKNFTQLIDINRFKTKFTDPNYISETGKAYGVDMTAKYERGGLYVWATFSHAYVNRYDGTQTYPTNFDRRNNINLLTSYAFGEKKSWEFAARWNYGSGFPFTLTQGFYSNFNYKDGVSTDVLTGNPDLGVIYSSKRNSGRLPDYHRMDISLKKMISFTKYVKMEVVASATNVYDRKNIFYFDRVRFQRVDQLPILPSLAATLHF